MQKILATARAKSLRKVSRRGLWNYLRTSKNPVGARRGFSAALRLTTRWRYVDFDFNHHPVLKPKKEKKLMFNHSSDWLYPDRLDMDIVPVDIWHILIMFIVVVYFFVKDRYFVSEQLQFSCNKSLCFCYLVLFPLLDFVHHLPQALMPH